MPIEQVLTPEERDFLEQMRFKILEDREIEPEELNRALTLLVAKARESRTITVAKQTTKKAAKAATPSLADLLSLGSKPIGG